MIPVERCEPEPRQTRAAAAPLWLLHSDTAAGWTKNEEKTEFYLFCCGGAPVVAREEKKSATLKSCEDRAAHAAPLRSFSACTLGLAPYLTVSRDRLDLLSGWWDWQAARSGGTVAAAVPPPPPPIPLSARSHVHLALPISLFFGWMDRCSPAPPAEYAAGGTHSTPISLRVNTARWRKQTTLYISASPCIISVLEKEGKIISYDAILFPRQKWVLECAVFTWKLVTMMQMIQRRLQI